MSVPIVEESVVNHRAYAASDENNDGNDELPNPAALLCLDADILCGKFGLACEKVAGCICYILVSLHLTEINLKKNEGNHHSDGEKRVEVEGDGHNEGNYCVVTVKEAADCRRPRGDRRNNAYRCCRRVDNVGELRARNSVLIANGTHNLSNGKTVEVVVNEDKASKSDRRKERTLSRLDFVLCPSAVSTRCTRACKDNCKDTENYEEYENSAVLTELLADYHNRIRECVNNIALCKEKSTDDNTCEQRGVNLLRDKCKHYRNDCGRKRPECSCHNRRTPFFIFLDKKCRGASPRQIKIHRPIALHKRDSLMHILQQASLRARERTA